MGQICLTSFTNAPSGGPIFTSAERTMHLLLKYFFIFFNVCPLKEGIFLTTFYGLYFSHHYTHITNYSLSHINHVPECQLQAVVFKYESGKTLSLAGIRTQDLLHGTSLTRYQLSCPDLIYY